MLVAAAVLVGCGAKGQGLLLQKRRVKATYVRPCRCDGRLNRELPESRRVGCRSSIPGLFGIIGTISHRNRFKQNEKKTRTHSIRHQRT